jgi:hypothetical protein
VNIFLHLLPACGVSSADIMRAYSKSIEPIVDGGLFLMCFMAAVLGESWLSSAAHLNEMTCHLSSVLSSTW